MHLLMQITQFAYSESKRKAASIRIQFAYQLRQ